VAQVGFSDGARERLRSPPDAFRRKGAILAHIRPGRTTGHGRGGDRSKSEGAHNSAPTQRQAAQSAGLSNHQRVTAVRVANVPAEDFDRVVDSETPPTVTRLADMGRKPRPAPEPVAPQEPPPAGFHEATHFLGALRRYAEVCRNPELLAGGFVANEVGEVRRLVSMIDGFHDRLVVNLKA
jgi:hypothetical protein